MRSKAFWIILACWIGAVVDAGAASMLMFPVLNTWITGEPASVDNVTFQNTTATAAALMWGWTVLLVWASRRPSDRYGVIAITIFPVLTWLTGSRIYNLANGLVDPSRNIPILILQLCILTLMVFSLWNYHHGKE